MRALERPLNTRGVRDLHAGVFLQTVSTVCSPAVAGFLGVCVDQNATTTTKTTKREFQCHYHSQELYLWSCQCTYWDCGRTETQQLKRPLEIEMSGKQSVEPYGLTRRDCATVTIYFTKPISSINVIPAVTRDTMIRIPIDHTEPHQYGDVTAAVLYKGTNETVLQ